MEGHRFLNSDVPEPFVALGHSGSDNYIGLELFDNPGCHSVIYTSDEVVAYCPITKQPDFYTLQIVLLGTEKLIESKSLKLWLRQFNNELNGIFCENLSVFIRNSVGFALGYEDREDGITTPDEEEIARHVQVTLTQKSRGGISIKAVA